MTKDEFIKSIKKLRIDFEQNNENWENKTIPDYLEALERYTEDIQSYYDNTKQEINSEKADWKIFSDILIGASIYE
ncbi:DUF7660 family protein [Flavobacterium dankookense]|uniref:DUF7660 domain-containing protein n=1 Tax=Flavobacterium dankookense TaxID=706186 RepID=A0A4R6QC13_9FLAO|nr:hypothetical protein [Flavobacterium dankookense]TDP59931.1 hypothetical protein BC748_0901 [Flavobacterium dankookense]